MTSGASSSSLPQPHTTEQAKGRVVSRAQASKPQQSSGRDILPAAFIPRHIYMSAGSYPRPIPALPPPEIQVNIPGIPNTVPLVTLYVFL